MDAGSYRHLGYTASGAKRSAAEGWRFVAVVRFVRLFVFYLTRYARGLTCTRFTAYVITSFICMAQGAFAGLMDHVATALNLLLDELPGHLTEINALRDRPVENGGAAAGPVVRPEAVAARRNF